MENENGYAAEGYTDREDQINWDEEGKPIPKGKYDLEVEDATYKLTSTNKHMVVVQFKINACHEPDTESAINKRVFENFVFAAGAAFRIKQFGKSAGIEDTLPTTINASILEEWAGSIKGIQVIGVTTLREFPVGSGEMRANINKFLPPNSVEGEAAGEEAEAAEPEAPKTSIRDAMSKQKNGNGAVAADAAEKPRPATRMVNKTKKA